MKRILSLFLCFIITVCAFAGCSKSETAYDFIYPFGADIKSYDPQVASTQDEFLIIENTFEGLIRINDDGTVVEGMADKWEISEDGLTYTFHIKEGMKWDINTDKYDSGENAGKFKDKRLQMMGKEFNPDITADDFVFALQRAAIPETNCPLFSTISCIKNANAVHSGKMSKDSLGVVATNPNVLTITLEHKDDSFMNTLTSAVAMPCNEEFFNATKGRYGLDTKYTLFNGQFYVNQILESSYLLKANKQYTGAYPTKAKELTLKIVGDEDKNEIISKLEDGYYDAAFISGHDSESIKKTKGISYIEYQDTTWAFILNSNDEALQSESIRRAFCKGFSRQDDFGKEYIKAAKNLIPASSLINGNNAVSAMGATAYAYDKAESIKNWKKGLNVIKQNDISITIITPDYMEESTKRLLQGVQSGIGETFQDSKGNAVKLTLKVELMSEAEIKSAIAQNEYDIALVPFRATNSSAVSFLSSVIESGYGDYDKDKASSYIEAAQSSGELGEIAKNLKNAENEILTSCTVCPVIYESSYYASAKGVTNIQFHAGTGRVSFVNAERE